jgi:gluconolactonase
LPEGDRRVALLDARLDNPQPNFITIADKYQGAKLNSPNDAVINSQGDIFFTDPPYGLPPEAEKELPFHGVYKVSDGQISFITDSVTFL